MNTNVNIKLQKNVNQFVNTILNNTNLAVKQYLDPEGHRPLFNASKLTDEQKYELLNDYMTPHFIKSKQVQKYLNFDILWLNSEIHAFNDPDYEFYDETGRSQREDEKELKHVKHLLSIAQHNPDYYWFTRHNLLDYSLKIDDGNFDTYQYMAIHLVDDDFIKKIKKAIIKHYNQNVSKMRTLVHSCLSSKERKVMAELLTSKDSRVDTNIAKRLGLIG